MKRFSPFRRHRVPAALPVATTFTSDANEIVTIRLDTRPETVRALAELLSAEELRRADRYDFDRDRRRFIVARARLRQLLAPRLMTQPEAVELVYGVNGKPALAQRSGDTDWRFNVSHSEEIAVYAFSQGREVGIDIEAIRKVRDADAIVSGFFSRCEQEAYLALGPGEKMLGFFNCWTRKEAFLKALGHGLSHPLDCFDVSLAPGEPARILRVKNAPGCDSGWCLDSFSPSPGFVAAVVAERQDLGVEAAASPSHSSISIAAVLL
jgi:4'-phosphopantetheinyl transferase